MELLSRFLYIFSCDYRHNYCLDIKVHMFV